MTPIQITVPMIDDPIIGLVLGFIAVYVVARAIWRLVPIVGG